MPNDYVMLDNSSAAEQQQRQKLLHLFRECRIPDRELLTQLSLFMKRQDVSAVLFMNEIYQQILDVHGSILEFGVRWGRNLAVLTCLRGIYEPFNHNRRIIGFDTFEGFPSVDEKDGADPTIQLGAYSVAENYRSYLEEILAYHESENPISHIRKFELIAGDATVTLREYLRKYPETIVAFAYFDFDIYAPTQECLTLVLEHSAKGTVIGFDELNVRSYPGETAAAKEVLGLRNCRLVHSRFSPTQSYTVL